MEAAKKYREQSASYQGEIDKAEKEIAENKKEIEDNNKITESFKDNNVTNKAIQEANKKAKQQTEDKYGEKDGKKNSEAAKTEDYNNKSDEMINKVDELYENVASGNRLSTKELENMNNSLISEKNQAALNNFSLPYWSYNNFAEEIDSFKKGLSSLTGEPGWFYFKLFFHFDDNYGLLGNIITNIDKRFGINMMDSAEVESSGIIQNPDIGNSAFNFLMMRKNNYLADNLTSRLYALVKFVKYLSFINCNAPWFFNSISGLANCRTDLKELTKEKSIDIGCIEEAIDMRLTSLFHLYQHACFDDVNIKEIIPENLRKFNMTVLVFHTPIKMIDTPVSLNGTNYNAAGLTNENIDERMSYKAYTFKGCEFDVESINSVVFGNALNNEQPINLGKASFKIKFDRCFSHVLNNWEHFLIGSDGTYYYDNSDIGLSNVIPLNTSGAMKKKLTALKNYSHTQDTSKIIDLNEENLRRLYKDFAGNTLGNLYQLNASDLIDAWIYGDTRLYGSMVPYLDGLYINNFDRFNRDYVSGEELTKSYEKMKDEFKRMGQSFVSTFKNMGKNMLSSLKGSVIGTAKMGLFNTMGVKF